MTLAVPIRPQIAAARPPLSLKPKNNQFLRTRATVYNAYTTVYRPPQERITNRQPGSRFLQGVPTGVQLRDRTAPSRNTARPPVRRPNKLAYFDNIPPLYTEAPAPETQPAASQTPRPAHLRECTPPQLAGSVSRSVSLLVRRQRREPCCEVVSTEVESASSPCTSDCE